MKQSLVWQLLRRNISKSQLTGYAVANLVGLSIVIGAVQFYRDITSVIDTDDSFISRDYIIISKEVGMTGSLLSNGAIDFSKSEIADIENQPWVRRVGKFTAASYSVAGALDLGGRHISTYLFFESIPDDFFDITPSQWGFDPETDNEVPIIISKDYLTLYNFGFASSRGMPQISESMIGMVPLKISISGNGRQQWINGRIVGFSSRLNTIAVPEEFMNWANANFADSPIADPSRLIIEVNTPGNPDIAEYLNNHGYESAGDKVDNGRAAYFLSIVTAVVIAVGTVISLLAFFILLLSIHLLMQKNRRKLHSLMMLGYSPRQVASRYYLLTGSINMAVLTGSIIIMLTASHLWRAPLEALGLTPAAPWIAIGTGIMIMMAITAGNFAAIRRSIRRAFPRPGNKPD